MESVHLRKHGTFFFLIRHSFNVIFITIDFNIRFVILFSVWQMKFHSNALHFLSCISVGGHFGQSCSLTLVISVAVTLCAQVYLWEDIRSCEWALSLTVVGNSVVWILQIYFFCTRWHSTRCEYGSHFYIFPSVCVAIHFSFLLFFLIGDLNM